MAERIIEPSDVYRDIARHRVIPVIAIDQAQHALPLADALIEGGLPLAEITFRTPAAAGVLRQLRDERPQLLLGAGTVLDPDSMHLALNCGARFALAPGFNPAVATEALEIEAACANTVALDQTVQGLPVKAALAEPCGSSAAARER